MNSLSDISALQTRCASLGARDAAALLATEDPERASLVLRQLLPNIAQDILKHLPQNKARAILAATPPDIARNWHLDARYPEDSVGSLMEPPTAV